MLKNKIINYYINKSIKFSNNYLNNKAISCINKILSFSDNCEALSFKGLYYSYLFEKEKSYECFNKIFKIDSQYIYGIYRQGLAFMQLNEYINAINCFKKILSIDPHHILTLNNIGMCYLNLEKYELALKYFNNIIKENPNDTNTLLNLSIYHSDLKQFDKSIKYLNKCLEINPNESRAMLEIANIYESKNNYENALKYIDMALEIDKEDLVLKLSKYFFLAKFKKFEQSLKGFEEISNTYFDDWELIKLYHIYYGLALTEMEKYDEALKLYDEYLEKYSNFPNEDILNEKENLLELMSEKD